MKLGKDEIQKLTLGLLMAAGVIYSYFAVLLGPLQTKQAGAQKAIKAVQPETAKAQAHIKKAQDAAQHETAARATVAQVSAMIPEGSPVAWFPPRLAELFKLHGVKKAAARLTNDAPDKDLPGFRRLAWGVEVPKIEFASFATALAQLENDEPLTEIATLQIETSRDDVETQNALLTLHSIVK